MAPQNRLCRRVIYTRRGRSRFTSAARYIGWQNLSRETTTPKQAETVCIMQPGAVRPPPCKLTDHPDRRPGRGVCGFCQEPKLAKEKTHPFLEKKKKKKASSLRPRLPGIWLYLEPASIQWWYSGASQAEDVVEGSPSHYCALPLVVVLWADTGCVRSAAAAIFNRAISGSQCFPLHAFFFFLPTNLCFLRAIVATLEQGTRWNGGRGLHSGCILFTPILRWADVRGPEFFLLLAC